MADSTAKVRPSKPREDFPLFPHASGRWAKKVKGQLRYFGSWKTDPKGEAANNLWLDQKDDLLAGREPRTRTDGLTVQDLCNEFYDAKEKMVAAGELSKRSLDDYERTCERVIKAFGKNRLVVDLTPADFRNLRSDIAEKSGPVTLGNEITRIKVVFNFAYKDDLIDRPVKFGSTFKRPSLKVLREHRQAKGERMFTARQIRRLLKAASPGMRAAILLGINAGYGNGDIGKLKTAALDLRRGWATFPRPKTSVARKCPLWPETTAALKEAMAINPKPARPEFEGLALLQETGYAWSKTDSADSPLSKNFRSLLDSLGMYRPGLSFYSLRHCHRTVSDGAGDAGASNVLMGHASSHISESYIEGRDDDRLVAVSNHVRRWLFRRGADAPAWQPVKGGRGDE